MTCSGSIGDVWFIGRYRFVSTEMTPNDLFSSETIIHHISLGKDKQCFSLRPDSTSLFSCILRSFYKFQSEFWKMIRDSIKGFDARYGLYIYIWFYPDYNNCFVSIFSLTDSYSFFVRFCTPFCDFWQWQGLFFNLLLWCVIYSNKFRFKLNAIINRLSKYLKFSACI